MFTLNASIVQGNSWINTHVSLDSWIPTASTHFVSFIPMLTLNASIVQGNSWINTHVSWISTAGTHSVEVEVLFQVDMEEVQVRISGVEVMDAAEVLIEALGTYP
ncbi:5553_t:CDS:2 [Funneliformis caledonium]|uniref:5553_t:CDS:1 n=1 Tax=Funneliformis caledonium TaxID=1117310 RepID=A0A9N8ZWW5_9GLOM|nr:5553_t:CDS:2 [Funneliformis caledonium]